MGHERRCRQQNRSGFPFRRWGRKRHFVSALYAAINRGVGTSYGFPAPFIVPSRFTPIRTFTSVPFAAPEGNIGSTMFAASLRASSSDRIGMASPTFVAKARVSTVSVWTGTPFIAAGLNCHFITCSRAGSSSPALSEFSGQVSRTCPARSTQTSMLSTPEVLPLRTEGQRMSGGELSKPRAVDSVMRIRFTRSAGGVGCETVNRPSSGLPSSVNSVTLASLVVPGSGSITRRRAIRLPLKSQ